MNRLQRPNSQKTRILCWLAVLLSIVLAGCGNNKSAQCKSILATIDQNRRQRPMGIQDKAAILLNIELAEQLATQLKALPIKDATLQGHVAQLAEGSHAEASALRTRASMVDQGGIVTISSNDPAKDAAYKQAIAQEMRSMEKQQLAMGLMVPYCRR